MLNMCASEGYRQSPIVPDVSGVRVNVGPVALAVAVDDRLLDESLRIEREREEKEPDAKEENVQRGRTASAAASEKPLSMGRVDHDEVQAEG